MKFLNTNSTIALCSVLFYLKPTYFKLEEAQLIIIVAVI